MRIQMRSICMGRAVIGNGAGPPSILNSSELMKFSFYGYKKAMVAAESKRKNSKTKARVVFFSLLSNGQI